MNNALFWIEIIGFHGIVLAWCAWEYWSLRRDKKRAEAVSAQRAGHAEGQERAHEGRGQAS